MFSKGAGAVAGAGTGAGRWESCTAPQSGLVELGNWCNAKIVQISCADSVEACTLRLPSSGLYGFSCLVVVVSAGQDVLLDLNGQQVRSCLDGQSTFDNQTLLVSPAIGTRLEIRCDGQDWFVHSDYARSLPPAEISFQVPSDSEVLEHEGMYLGQLTSPTDPEVQVIHSAIQTATASFPTKGKIFKIVNGRNNAFGYTGSFLSVTASVLFNANDTSVSSGIRIHSQIMIGSAGADSNQSTVGDSFVVVHNGQHWFMCGSSFGNIM